MTLTETYALAHDEAFLERVTMCAVKAALDVMAEASPTPVRKSYAGLILRNPTGAAQAVALTVASLGTLTEESSDSDLQWTVNSVYDALATALAG